ncbi:C45 family autoproteolytic acyltransferase/hydrolase [Galbibacter sp. EGI 63066]|uniref:C45 family autoproteolytic acyltransferase/hydolase n=1 Tax=Galbibacter sp. EGI 63066 TaxID=2993559 RepID=UPI0022490610|nr:C45 family peptidase [Galbibacter sp. EGI 63066]MCX2678354.1 C45 family autoproteolytic acyltransferase/hydrolase [Galbibacter sp. EGI 63066]
MHRKHRIYIFVLGWTVLLLTSCGIKKSINDHPDVSMYNADIPKKKTVNDSTFVAGDNFITKNSQGLWELYVEGDPLQRGMLTGSLSQDLFHYQEKVFLSKVEELVPSKFKQSLLRKFLAWYNRKMYLHIPEEYKTEIYGLSRYASSEFNHIASPYLRVLYLHGAHDIGHALQDLALVGCTSFAAWGNKTEDGSLIIGRNFDFYAGDDFAKEKIVAFINPTEGHKFMSVTWGGMIGVVSGMNEKGLTVTINAGKSDIPLVAKTPISIVTREILQYAENIEEAIAIAKKRKVFVSESIFVGSAADKKAILIEVSPDNFGVYEVENTNTLICSNHFQSNAYKNDKNNQERILESHSKYRFDRMTELLDEHPEVTPEIAVDILRNKDGLNDKKIGYGNERALNQLLAHHAIVFKPEQRLVWVSTNPYQLGAFVTFDLNKVFDDEEPKKDFVLNEEELRIKKDTFLYTQAYKDYEKYRVMKRDIQKKINDNGDISPQTIRDFINSNSYNWEVYSIIGTYYYQKKYYLAALEAFQEAAKLEITTVPDKEYVEKYIEKSKRKISR